MARGQATSRRSTVAAAASVKAPPSRESPTHLFSIKSFCAAHGISEGFYFQLRAQGLGPDELRLGTRVLITHEAAARWRAEREAATESGQSGQAVE
jgi:hypothetical protein